MTGKDWLEGKGRGFLARAYAAVSAGFSAEGDAAVAEYLTPFADLEAARVTPEILSKARSSLGLVRNRSPRAAAVPAPPPLAIAPQAVLPGMTFEERQVAALEKIATAVAGLERSLWAIEHRLRGTQAQTEAA